MKKDVLRNFTKFTGKHLCQSTRGEHSVNNAHSASTVEPEVEPEVESEVETEVESKVKPVVEPRLNQSSKLRST